MASTSSDDTTISSPADSSQIPAAKPNRVSRTVRLRRTCRNSNSLDSPTDKAIVEYCVSPDRLVKRFEELCDEQEHIFGAPCSKQRRRVQNRFNKLQNFQRGKLRGVAEEYGVIAPESTQLTLQTPEKVESTFSPSFTQSYLPLESQE